MLFSKAPGRAAYSPKHLNENNSFKSGCRGKSVLWWPPPQTLFGGAGTRDELLITSAGKASIMGDSKIVNMVEWATVNPCRECRY